MTLFNYINANIDQIKTEIKLGIIPCSILRYWEIYARYDIYKKMGQNTTMAVFQASEQCNASEETVYRSIRKMEATNESLDLNVQPVNASGKIG
jgi:hypothetical protein